MTVPPLSQGLDDRPPPLSQGLDPALVSPLIFYLRTKNYATVEIHVHFYCLFYHSMYSCKLHEKEGFYVLPFSTSWLGACAYK